MEPNTPIALAVAAYAQPQRAQQDFADAWEHFRSGDRRFAIAELGQDVAGTLRVTSHHSGPANPAWGSALLAAALVLIVAPAGAAFLASVPSVRGAGAVAGHLQRTVPSRELEQATNLLEEQAAGVIVVAVDRRPKDLMALLGRADGSVTMTSVWNGLDRAIEQEIAESLANPSGT